MLRLLLMALGVLVASAGQVTPVQKVLDMLDRMKAKGEAASEAEKTVFAEYAGWADDEMTKLSQEIETGTNSISKLTAFIVKAESDVHVLKTAIAELDDEMGRLEEEKKAATAMRSDERAEYQKASADYQESIDAVAMAIQTIRQQAYDRPEAMLQIKKLAVKAPGVRRVLAALLETDDTKALVHGAPAVAAYEAQTGGIVDILEGLEDKFQEQLRQAEDAESNSAHAYDLQVLHLSNLLKECKADREEKAAIKARTSGESASAQGELVDAKADLAEDQKALRDTENTLAAKKSQFAANQNVRAQEIKALSKAIEIISKMADGNFLQMPAHKSVSFLQARSRTASQRTLAFRQAAEFLRERAKALSSRRLAAVAADIASSPFRKVVKMIEDMVAKLKEEAGEEADHKAWCDEELKKNKAKRDKKTSQVSSLVAQVEETKSTISSIASTISELSKEQAELARAMAEGTALRSDEKAKNLATIKDAQVGRSAVKKALVVLHDFYSSQALLQTEQAPEMAEYKGMHGAKGGVVGMLEVIEADFSRLETEAQVEERQAAEFYTEFMAESKVAKKQKHEHEFKLSLKKDKVEFDLAQTRKALMGTQEELDKATEYYAYLKPNCINVKVSVNERETSRQEEIAALKETYRVLNEKLR